MSLGAIAEAVAIQSHLDGSALGSLGDDVRDRLTRKPLKELAPKYFYDARGSDLFDRITEQPEYYPTRCERAILNRRAPEIARMTGATELVELGSGSASKTRALLYAMAGAGTLERFVPMDCSPEPVERCAVELTDTYPGLSVHGVVGERAERRPVEVRLDLDALGCGRRAHASLAQRKPAKIWRRCGKSQLRNVLRTACVCVAHDPPRRTL